MNTHVGVSDENESGIPVEKLLRPPLPGRKVHSENRRDGDEGSHTRGWERRGRRRKRISIENIGDGSGEGGSTESLSSSGSDHVESADGSTEVPSGRSFMSKTLPRHRPPSLAFIRSASPIPSRPHRASSSGTTVARPPGRPAGDPLRVDAETAGGSSRTLLNEGEASRLDEKGEEDEEGGGMMDLTSPSCPALLERKMSKKERKRIKCVRRRQRRKERLRQSQRQCSTGSVSSSGGSSSGSEEDKEDVTKEGYVCAVCLDIYFSPYMCKPCKHIFCEPCLRTLANNCPASTPCPLCRTIITHVFFQKELNQMARTFFPKEYACRKQNFQKACCAKWPLPSGRKFFRIFGGFRRPSSPGAQYQSPRTGGGFHLSALDFDDNTRSWHIDMDMVIIYIYSVNWIVGFFVFCIFCYLFFPSF
ncbi:E3 ubiquitin-protein ligase RNF180 [Hippocampus zosterae]|uniref:E3 ubiquitin-protein ligase RNF180 n=1 Tax=Hippocampus zosterae TaxID=109293 RepID=UPI00223D07F8|nr:E3 ubiquitin-protein ligase RNF180 [Hippocampus zosterae]